MLSAPPRTPYNVSVTFILLDPSELDEVEAAE